MARADLDRAAVLLSSDLAAAARALSDECASAGDAVGFPHADGLADQATALLRQIRDRIATERIAA